MCKLWLKPYPLNADDPMGAQPPVSLDRTAKAMGPDNHPRLPALEIPGFTGGGSAGRQA